MDQRSAQMLASYNSWCNERLYAAAGELSAAELQADRGVFFRSMTGTLNHMLVADRIWLARLTGADAPPYSLDTLLHEDLADLRREREAEDRRIEEYVARLSEAALAAPFSYRSITKPATVTQSIGDALLHFFNHQTHHRGQAHAILSGFGKNPPSFDLVLFQRECGWL